MAQLEKIAPEITEVYNGAAEIGNSGKGAGRNRKLFSSSLEQTQRKSNLEREKDNLNSFMS